MYADDTKVYNAITSESSVASLKSDLRKLEAWAQLMQMKFHPLKCKVMHLGKTNPKETYQMKTADGNFHNLEETEVEKDLGVEIDNKHVPDSHVFSVAEEDVVDDQVNEDDTDLDNGSDDPEITESHPCPEAAK